MAIAYKSAGAGAGTETSSAQLALVCPATVDANDILIAHLNWIDNVSEPTDPSGWTRLYTTSGLGAAMGTGTPVGRSYVYGKIAVGDEDGTTVNFGTAGGTKGRFGCIYSFSGYVSGTLADVVPAASFSDIPKEDDPALPTVTTTLAGALAIALIAQDDNNSMVAGGAQTGGTWAGPVAEFVSTTIGAQGCVCQIQTCTPTADPGRVTGGVLTTVADESSTIGFEIRPSPVSGGPLAIVDDLEDAFSEGTDERPSPTTYWYIGNNSGSAESDWGGIYRTTGIPQGATILNAYIALTRHNTDNGGTTVTGDWYGYDVDSPADFVEAHTHRVSDHETRTTANVSDSITVANLAHTSPSLTAVIQEIVDRAGFAGDIGITFRSTTASATYYSVPDYATVNTPVLVVTWEAGAGGIVESAVDGATASDSAPARLVSRPSAVDGVTATDAATARLVQHPTASDGAVVADAAAASSPAKVGTGADVSIASDAAAARTVHGAPATDGVAAADAAVARIAHVAGASDGVTASDGASPHVSSVEVPADQGLVTDAASVRIVAHALAGDSARAADDAFATIAIPGVVAGTGTDGLAAADGAAVVQTHRATALDGIAAGDAASARLVARVQAIDGAVAFDAGTGPGEPTPLALAFLDHSAPRYAFLYESGARYGFADESDARYDFAEASAGP